MRNKQGSATVQPRIQAILLSISNKAKHAAYAHNEESLGKHMAALKRAIETLSKRLAEARQKVDQEEQENDTGADPEIH